MLGDFFAMILIGIILAATNVYLAIAVALYFGILTRGYQQIEHRLIDRASRAIHEEQACEYQSIQQSFAVSKKSRSAMPKSTSPTTCTSDAPRTGPAYRTITMSALVPRYVLEVAMFGPAAIIAAAAFSTDTVAGATATIGVFLAGGFRILVPLNRVVFAVSQNRAACPSLEQVHDDLTNIPSDVEDPAPGADRRIGPVDQRRRPELLLQPGRPGA